MPGDESKREELRNGDPIIGVTALPHITDWRKSRFPVLGKKVLNQAITDAGLVRSDAIGVSDAVDTFSGMAEEESRPLRLLLSKHNRDGRLDISGEAFTFFVTMWDSGPGGKAFIVLLLDLIHTDRKLLSCRILPDVIGLGARMNLLNELRGTPENYPAFNNSCLQAIRHLQALDEYQKGKSFSAPLLGALVTYTRWKPDFMQVGGTDVPKNSLPYEKMLEIQSVLGRQDGEFLQLLFDIGFYDNVREGKPGARLLASCVTAMHSGAGTGKPPISETTADWVDKTKSPKGKYKLLEVFFLNLATAAPILQHDGSRADERFTLEKVEAKSALGLGEASPAARGWAVPEVFQVFAKGMRRDDVRTAGVGEVVSKFAADRYAPTRVTGVILSSVFQAVYARPAFTMAREVAQCLSKILKSQHLDEKKQYILGDKFDDAMTFIQMSREAMAAMCFNIYKAVGGDVLPTPATGAGAAAASAVMGSGRTETWAPLQIQTAIEQACEAYVRQLLDARETKVVHEWHAAENRYTHHAAKVVDSDGSEARSIVQEPDAVRRLSLSGKDAVFCSGMQQAPEIQGLRNVAWVSPMFLERLKALLANKDHDWAQGVLDAVEQELDKHYPFWNQRLFDRPKERLGAQAGRLMRLASMWAQPRRRAAAPRLRCGERCRSAFKNPMLYAWLLCAMGSGAVAVSAFVFHAGDFDQKHPVIIALAHLLPLLTIPTARLVRHFEGRPGNLKTRRNAYKLAVIQGVGGHLGLSGDLGLRHVRYSWAAGYLNRFFISNMIAVGYIMLTSLLSYGFFGFDDGALGKQYAASAWASIVLTGLVPLAITTANLWQFWQVRAKDWREQFNTELETQLAQTLIGLPSQVKQSVASVALVGWTVGVPIWFIWNHVANGELRKEHLIEDGTFIAIAVLASLLYAAISIGPRRTLSVCARGVKVCCKPVTKKCQKDQVVVAGDTGAGGRVELVVNPVDHSGSNAGALRVGLLGAEGASAAAATGRAAATGSVVVTVKPGADTIADRNARKGGLFSALGRAVMGRPSADDIAEEEAARRENEARRDAAAARMFPSRHSDNVARAITGQGDDYNPFVAGSGARAGDSDDNPFGAGSGGYTGGDGRKLDAFRRN